MKHTNRLQAHVRRTLDQTIYRNPHTAPPNITHGHSQLYGLFTDRAPYNNHDNINVQHKDFIGVLLTADAA